MFPCKVQSLFMAPQGHVGIAKTPAGSSFSHPAEQETVKPQKCWAKHLESTGSQAPCPASTSTKVLHWKMKCAGHLQLFLHRAQQELGVNNSLGSRTEPTGTKCKHGAKARRVWLHW